MGLAAEKLERQLTQANSRREACESQLSSAGTSADAYKRNHQWRSLNANCRRLRERLKAAKAVEALTAEVEARKASPDSGE